MQPSIKLTIALLGVVACLLVARTLLPHKEEPKTMITYSQLGSSVYYNNPFTLSLKNKFKVAAPTFSVNSSEIILNDHAHIGINFSLPQEYRNTPLHSFSVVGRDRSVTPNPTLFVALEKKLLEYRCNLTVELDNINCPVTPKIHDISNVIGVYYDANASLSFVAHNESNTGRVAIKMAIGEDIDNVVDSAVTLEPCSKFFFAPEYAQLLCVRTSGLSLDAYHYSNVTKKMTYENFTAEGQKIASLDDFVFDFLNQYVNSGIIRVKEDILFVRNEVRRTLKDPFGDGNQDFRILANFPKLIAVSKRQNRILQFDYSRIENVKKEGEYDLRGCSLSNESSVHMSHDADMFYLTCDKDSTSYLYVFTPSTMNLRKVVPLKSMKKSVFRYALLNIGIADLDVIFSLEDSKLTAQKIYNYPSLLGNTANLKPTAGSTIHPIPFKVNITSALGTGETEIIEGKVTVIFPERPIEPLSDEVVLEAVKRSDDTYNVYFGNHQLFKGSVHNMTFEPIPSSQSNNLSWSFTPITDFTNNILVPNVSSAETIYDYHYLPVKSNDPQHNDGVFILLTTNDQTKKGYLTTYKVTREDDGANFKSVNLVNKFQIDDPYCTMLTIVNIGEFSLDNLFGFVQCQMRKVAIYGYALANGTKVLDQSIQTSEAWLNFAFDDVYGHIVVFHSSLDRTQDYIEFLQFYPLGQQYNNPVKTIPFSALQMAPKEVFQPAGYDLIVNPNSQTFEIYSIALDGTLVYCSTPFHSGMSSNLKGGDKEFCVKKKITELIGDSYTVKAPAWNGLQIIKDYQHLSAQYLVGYSYSNGLQFVINSETAPAYMFKVTQSAGARGLELAAATQFGVLKGFADYYPDYKKLTFFNVDETYVMFVGHTFRDNNEFAFIVFDHSLNESNSNYYRFTSFPILEATGGKRYRSTDIGLSPTRIFTENPSDYDRRIVTLGADNTLLQYFITQHNTLTIKGECKEVKFNVKAINDRFENETVVRVACPQSAPQSKLLKE